jgi:hypothetical protein
MSIRQIVAALALCIAPVVAYSADDDFNPYKSAKVGDFANYKVTVKFGQLSIVGSASQSVTAKSEKEATIKVVGSVSGMEIPPQTQIIDLTKPFDPTKTTGFPAGLEGTVEKLKDGKEKVKVGTKEYDTTWTTYKVKVKNGNTELEGTAKTWMSKEIPLGVVKIELSAEEANKKGNGKDNPATKIEMTMEVTEHGNKK